MFPGSGSGPDHPILTSEQSLDAVAAEASLRRIKECDVPQGLPLNESVQVWIAHVNNPSDFYVLRKNQQAFIDKLAFDLPAYMSWDGQELFRKGDDHLRCNVAVYNYAPKKWKRLKVIKQVSSKNSLVQYIDWGDEEILPLDALRVPPEQLEEIPPLAIHCTLDVEPIQGDPESKEFWEVDLAKAMSEDLEKKNCPSSEKLSSGGLRARAVAKVGDKNVVLLHVLGAKHWGTKLVEDSLGIKMKLFDPASEISTTAMAELQIADQDHDGSHPNESGGVTNADLESIETEIGGQYLGLDLSKLTGKEKSTPQFSQANGANFEVVAPYTSSETATAAIELELNQAQPELPEALGYKYTQDKLTDPHLPLEEQNLGEHTEYRITAALDLDLFHVVLKHSYRNDYAMLKVAINEHMMRAEAKKPLDHPPRTGDVVIAETRGGKQVKYSRGVITTVSGRGWLQLRDVDTAESSILPASCVYQINDEIFEIPKIGFIVRHAKVDTESQLILQSNFDGLMAKLKKKGFIVKILEVGSQTKIPHVLMQCCEDEEYVHQKINKLKKWNWELIYEGGARTDDEIVKRCGRLCSKAPPPLSQRTPLFLDFSAMVRRVDIFSAGVDDHKESSLGTNTPAPKIVLEPILPAVQKMKLVLENQIHKYTDTVTASQYYPSCDEILLIQAPCDTQWHRAIKLSPNQFDFYAVDSGVRYNAADGAGGYKYRKVPADFAAVPFLLLDMRSPSLNYTKIHRQAFEEVFKPNEQVVISFSLGNENGSSIICDALINRVDELRGLTETGALTAN